jgi:hypothetical protein
MKYFAVKIAGEELVNSEACRLDAVHKIVPGEQANVVILAKKPSSPYRTCDACIFNSLKNIPEERDHDNCTSAQTQNTVNFLQRLGYIFHVLQYV